MMLRKVILLFTLAAISQSSFCQQLYMEKTFGGARFETDSLTVSMRQVLFVMRENQEAYNEFNKARHYSSAASLVGFSGGVLITFPLVTAAVGGKPEWALAAAGGALILITIPLTQSFYRHAGNALETYNMKYQTRRVDPRFYFTGTGGKLVLKF